MRAAYLEKQAGPEALVIGEIPRPRPGPDEVLVKVHATAVMPTELHWVPTFSTPSGLPRTFPVVLSHEFSGVVAEVGASVSAWRAGEDVYGLNDWFINGAQAEYCVVSAAALARKPRSLDHNRSAVVPISALTAWQGLFEKTNLERGQRVLIHGAAGGVGTFAVQLAAWRGAYAIATASSVNVEFARSLGAHEVIDYRATPFDRVVKDVDVVFDSVGGDVLARSWSVLKTGGKLVTIVGEKFDSPDRRVRDAFLLVRADGTQLTEIANLIDAGRLRVFVAAVFPLTRVRDAFAQAQQGGNRGKVALQVGN